MPGKCFVVYTRFPRGLGVSTEVSETRRRKQYPNKQVHNNPLNDKPLDASHSLHISHRLHRLLLHLHHSCLLLHHHFLLLHILSLPEGGESLRLLSIDFHRDIPQVILFRDGRHCWHSIGRHHILQIIGGKSGSHSLQLGICQQNTLSTTVCLLCCLENVDLLKECFLTLFLCLFFLSFLLQVIIHNHENENKDIEDIEGIIPYHDIQQSHLLHQSP